ncbi:MAG: hypothetical protein QXO70_03585, partial [Candidatus Pacearchaeota archaeon]
MSQEEVLRLLEKKKAITIKEVSKELNISIVAAWYNLTDLFKNKEIKRIEIRPEKCEKYNFSKAGRKHFLWKKK